MLLRREFILIHEEVLPVRGVNPQKPLPLQRGSNFLLPDDIYIFDLILVIKEAGPECRHEETKFHLK